MNIHTLRQIKTETQKNKNVWGAVKAILRGRYLWSLYNNKYYI